MKDSKNLVIGLLCAVVCIMAVAYAAFSSTLNVTGTATISGNWKVGFLAGTATDANDNVVCTSSPVGPTEIGEATLGMDATVLSADTTEATFTATLFTPGDEVSCVIKVNNAGSMDAKLSDVVVQPESNNAPITYTVLINEGTEEAPNWVEPEADQTLNSGAIKQIKVTAEYNETQNTQPDDGALSKKLYVKLVYVDANAE